MPAQSELDVIVRGRDELTPDLSKIESRVIRAVGAISAALAGVRLVSFPVDSAREFERELANVTKTTNFTTDQVQTLGVELLKMSTRLDVSGTDLAKIAAAAGQQGLGREGVKGVLAFTDSVSRMASVLDLSAEDAGDQIGKIINIFKVPIQDVEQVASIFNQVSNNSTASGEQLLDVVRRIGDAAGSINLQQAVGLAATGIDFGQSPEVVGTAYARVFSSLFEKADQFTRLMNNSGTVFVQSASDWVNIVQKDGIAAFKKVLAQLRTLEGQSQVNAITKLFGGGRIGVLVQKLVNDVNDEVLERNLAQAREGSSGISALREQQTVLNTFDAQLKILGNSVKSLAITSLWADIGQGATSMQELAAYTAKFSAALQEPGSQSFLNALIGGVVDLVKGFANAAEFVAGFNVNWENFVRVGVAFVGLKLGESILGLATRFIGLDKALQSTSKSVADVGAASTAASAAEEVANQRSKASLAARLLGLEELEAKYKEFSAQQAKLSLLDNTKNQQQAELAAARQLEAAKQSSAARGELGLAQSSRNVGDVTRDLQQTEKAREAAVAQLEARRTASALAAEQTRQQKLLQAQEAYQERLDVINQSGSTTGLTALRREYARQQELTEQEYTKRINAVNGYWDRQVAATVAGAQATVKAQQAILAKANTNFDTVLATQSSQQAGAGAAGTATQAAEAALAETNAVIAASTTKVSLFQRVTSAAGVAFRAFAGIVVSSARLLVGAFGWVTLIYSVLDALGVIDKLGAGFQRLTDAIGLTSKAQRDKAVADEVITQNLNKQLKSVNELISAYQKYQDVRTGQVSDQRVQGLAKETNSLPTQDDRQKSLQDLIKIAEGASASINQVGDLSLQTQEKNLEKAKGNVDSLQDEIAKVQKKLASAQSQALTPGLTDIGDAGVKKYSAELAALQSALDVATKKSQTFKDGIEAGNIVAIKAGKDLDTVAKGFATLFTDTSAQGFEQYVVPLVNAKERMAELLKQAEDLNQTAAKFTPGSDERAQADQDAKAALTEYQTQVGVVAQAQQNLIDFQNRIGKQGGVSPEVLKSVEDLSQYTNISAQAARTLLDIFSRLSGMKIDLTGLNAGISSGATSKGTDKFNPGNTEGEQRRLARARLKYERETIQQENALKDELGKEALAAEQRLYDQGLVSITDYYNERKRIETQSAQFDIDDKKRELDEINKEIGEATVASEKYKMMADAVRVQGQINVLEARKDDIDKQIEDEKKKATLAFDTRVGSETDNLFANLVKPGSADDIFKNALDTKLLQYQTFLSQLDAESYANPVFKELADNLRKSFTLDAFKASLAGVQGTTDLLTSHLQNLQTSLNLAGQSGDLTGRQIEASFNQAIKDSIPLIQQQMEILQQRLEVLKQTDGASSTAYKQTAEQVETMRLALAQIMAQADQTAKSINSSIVDSLADSIDSIDVHLDNLKDVATSFITDVANNIKKVISHDLAEGLLQSLGTTGSGGIGGFIQNSILNRGGTSANVPQRGNTFANPLYVQDATGGIGNALTSLTAADSVQGLGTDISSSIEGLTGSWQKVAADGIKVDAESSEGFFSGISDSLGNVFSGLGGTLSGLFKDFTGSLSSLFSSFFGNSGTQSAVGSFFGGLFTSSVAHGGGVIGQSPLRRRMVHPAIFNNAPRYHNGTMGAGLRSDEVPAILQKGETVRTKQQEAALQNGQGAGGGIEAVNVYIVPEGTKPGVGKNDIVVTIADDLATNGRTARLVKTIIAGRL